MQRYFSIRMKLDDVVKELDREQLILENIRRCSKIGGKLFKVVFWHENLTKKECEDFIKRNDHLLFEVNTQITKEFEDVWFLIKSPGDNSKSRYRCDGDILFGLTEYIKIITHIIKRDKE